MPAALRAAHAGVTAGLDLCLHLIRRDQGPAAANARARALVAPPRRTGGQAQFGLNDDTVWLPANDPHKPAR